MSLEIHSLNPKYLGEPLYMQLYSHLRDGILAGQIRAGERLPSKRQLAADLNMSQNTVIRAYQQLLDEGYIRARERSGYYVEEISVLYRPLELDVKTPKKGSEEDEKEILYDFGYGGVDNENFPWKILQKTYRKVISAAGEELCRMPQEQGHERLRETLSSYLYRARGFYVDPEQIVLGSGTDYLLNILFEVLPESASYGIEDPGFPRVAEALCQRKRNYSPIPLDESGVRLAELIKSNVDILAITPSHQFPSGCIYPMSRRSELLAWVEKLGRYIIEDDYDSEFKFETRPIPPLKSMDSAEKVIYLGSFSKSFSPAMRISYMVLPKSLMEAYHSKLILFPCPVPLLTQLVMADLIETGAFTRHLNRMRILYKKKREILLKELQQAREYWEIEGADAGLHLVIKLRDMAAKEFAAAALAAGIKVYPLSEYAITADTGERILLSYAQIALSEIELAARGLVGVAKGFAD